MVSLQVENKQKTTYVLNRWQHQEGTLDRSSSLKDLSEVLLFPVLLKFPTPCGHMKGFSIWEILLPNHKYFIYPNQ